MPMPPRVHSLLSWFAGMLVIAVLLWRGSIDDTLHEVRSARFGILLPLMAAASMGWFLVDSAAFAFLFSRMNTPLSFARARELRGLTYLLTPIHWNLGRVAVLARLHRSHGVPLLEAGSSLALYQTLDAALLSGLSWIGLTWLPASPVRETLRPVVATLVISLVAYLWLIQASSPRWAFVSRLRDATIHHAHRRAHLKDQFTILCFRIIYFSILVSVYYWGANAFGMHFPLPLVVASVPIIQAIGTLPISPSGLGTQQAAMLYFFSAQGDPAAIIAFGLSIPLLTIALRSAIGWPYLYRLNRSDVGRAEIASAKVH